MNEINRVVFELLVSLQKNHEINSIRTVAMKSGIGKSKGDGIDSVPSKWFTHDERNK
jgi:hypothetical protein